MAYMTDENGNYKRTVRCGHCYEKGHNKSACPKRKQDLQSNIEHYTKELANSTAPADDWQRKNIERYLQRSKDQLHKMETRGQNRKCGFCSETGHTRRTCPHRKAKVAESTRDTLDFRAKVLARMVEAGYAPGCLVEVRNPIAGSSAHVLAIVTDIGLDRVETSMKVSKDNYFNVASGVQFTYVTPVTDSWGTTHTNGVGYIDLTYMNVDDVCESEWYRNQDSRSARLVSGVDASEQQVAGPGALDQKQVSKWVADNIIDPR